MTLTRPLRNKENVDRRRGILEEDATQIKTRRGKKAQVRGGGPAPEPCLQGAVGSGGDEGRGQSEGENAVKWTWAADRPATQASTS